MVIGIFLFFGIRHLEYLSIADIGATGDAEENENRGEYSPKSQPFIQIVPYKETKDDAAGHGQPQLHDNGQIFCPVSVFFIVEQTAFPYRFIDFLFSSVSGSDGVYQKLEKKRWPLKRKELSRAGG